MDRDRVRLIFNGRNDWLEARKEGIGASDVATIVGLNPHDTPYQLWRRKIGLDPPKPMNMAMNTGHILEDGVAQFWAQATGREIIKSSRADFMFVDKERPYLRVSPDRAYWIDGMAKNDDNKGILECKTTRTKIDPENIPRYWFCQVQMNLGVARYTHGSLAWLSANHGFDFGYIDLNFVPDFYAWLVDEVSRFWVDNVKGGKEPNPINAKDVIIRYNQHVGGKVLECGHEVLQAYQRLKQVREEIKALEVQAAGYEDMLKMVFKDAEAIAYNGETLATWKAPKPSTKFDAKAFQADHPDLAQPYIRTTQGTRRFLLK